MRTASFFGALTLGALLVVRTVPGGHKLEQAGPGVVRMDRALDRLIARGAGVEKVADGFTWVEGPVWNRAGRYLLFSDIPNNAVFRWREGEGASLYAKPSGYSGAKVFAGHEPGSNGLAFDDEGRLVLCEHGDRRVARLEMDGRHTTLADRFQGKRLNSPNDLVFRRDGSLFFTDPPFGLPRAFEDPGKELPFQGVYRYSAQDGLRLVTKDVRAPNGIAFSPDERTLYVSNADRANAVWYAFDVDAEGRAWRQRIFFDATAWAKTKPGAPDGMKVDKHGNLFAAGPGGIHVLSPGGSHLGLITFDQAVSNCAWGGDGSMLYITAGSALYRVRTLTNGR